jgi:hypothetical protein
MVPFAKASASIPKISKNINLKYNIEKKKANFRHNGTSE